MMRVLIIATAVGCAAMGGVFFAFSTFVMAALHRLPPAQGIAAMQSMNITAVTPMFMTALFGAAAACLGVAVTAVIDWRTNESAFLIAGTLSYLIGAIIVTIAVNVPLNNALAAADPSSAAAGPLWTHYVRTWTSWNHVRTVGSLVAAALLIAAIFT